MQTWSSGASLPHMQRLPTWQAEVSLQRVPKKLPSREVCQAMQDLLCLQAWQAARYLQGVPRQLRARFSTSGLPAVLRLSAWASEVCLSALPPVPTWTSPHQLSEVQELRPR